MKLAILLTSLILQLTLTSSMRVSMNLQRAFTYADDGSTCTKVKISNYAYWWNKNKVNGVYDILPDKRLKWDTKEEYEDYPIYGNSEDMYISYGKQKKWRIGTIKTIESTYTHQAIQANDANHKYPHQAKWKFQMNVECIEFNEGCFTTNSSDSPQQGKPCVLKDWIYEKDTKVYKGCANPGSTSDAAWCPTKIENGVFLTNSDEWGYCNEDCTIIDGGIDGCGTKLTINVNHNDSIASPNAWDVAKSFKGTYDVGSNPIYVNNRTYWTQKDGQGAVWLDTSNVWRIGLVENVGKTQTSVYAPNATLCPHQAKFWNYDAGQQSTSGGGNCTVSNSGSLSVNCSFQSPAKWITTQTDIIVKSNGIDNSSTSTENEESSPNVSGLLSIRFQNDSTTPEMYFDHLWNPICAHHFADNDFGAELFCRKLGYDTGKIKEREVLLNVDALNIGTCLEEDTWMRCSGGCNSHEIGGICQGKSCKSGEKAGVEIKCENYCYCNPHGSKQYYCDADGKCSNCKDNISGDLCDRCDTGFVDFPDCTAREYVASEDRSGGCDTYKLKESHVTQFPIPFGQHIFNRLDSAIIAYNHIKNCSGDSGLNLYNELFNPSGKCIKPRYTEDPVNQTPCAELLPGHKIVNTLGITIPESFVDTNPTDDPNNCRFIFVTEASKADLITLDPYSETKQAIEKMDGTIKDFLQNSGTFPLTEADIIQLGNKLVDDYWKSILEPSCDDDEGDACSTQTLNDCVTESAMNIKQWADAKTWFVSQKVRSSLKDFSSLMKDEDKLKLMEVYRNADSDQIEMLENNLQSAKESQQQDGPKRLSELTSIQSLRTKPSSSAIDIPKQTQNSAGGIRSQGTLADLKQLPPSRSSDLAYATHSYTATIRKHADTIVAVSGIVPWEKLAAISGMFSMMGLAGAKVGAVLELIDFADSLIYGVPDSAELAYMKQEFKRVNAKLDKVLQDTSKLQSGLEFSDATKDINLVVIHGLYEDVDDMMKSFKNDMRAKGAPSTKTTDAKAEFNARIKNSEVETSIENLLAAVINPKLNPLTGNEDLITLYMSKEGQDCQAGLQFGMDILEILKKSRKVIDFYHNTENLDPFTFDGMEWQKIFQTLTKKVYTAVVACLRTYRSEAETQLKTIKEDGHAKIYAEMSKRFRQFEWFVLDLPSSGLVSNTKVDLNSINVKQSQADQDSYIFYRPYSRYDENEFSEEFKNKIKDDILSWCNYWESRPLYDFHFEPYEVINMIKSGATSCRKTEYGLGAVLNAGISLFGNDGDCTEFDLAKNHTNKIRDLIVTKAPVKSLLENLHANFETDLPQYTDNFDLTFKCQKQGKIPFVTHVPVYVYTENKIPITTDFWIMMNFHTEEPKEVTKCCPDGGERHYVAGQPDGTESFCVCKGNFYGDDCSSYLPDDFDEMFAFGSELEALNEPSMFDLKNAVKEVGEKILNRIDALQDTLIDAIKQDGDKTREAIAESAIKQMNYVNNEISNLQSAIGFKLGGFRNATMKKFLRQELLTKEGTRMILSEVTLRFDSIDGSLRVMKCMMEKQSLNPHLQELEELLQHWTEIKTDFVKTEEFYTALHHDYLHFRDQQLPSLIDSMNGRKNGVARGKSLIEIEMTCFDPDQYCTDKYHEQLRKQEDKLLGLYTGIMEMQTEFFNEKSTELTILESNSAINQGFHKEKEYYIWINSLENEACPKFNSSHFGGGNYEKHKGCDAGSTYIGQIIDLQVLCKSGSGDETAIPVFKDANDNYKQVQSAECVEDTDENAEKNCIVKTMDCIDDFGIELEDNPCERRRCNKWEINGDDLTEKPASQDPSNVFCLLPCAYTDPITKDAKEVKVGENVTLPDTSARGYSWVASNETKTPITHLKCIIAKDPEGFPVSEMEKYESVDYDECQNTNPKTGQAYCDMKKGKCLNIDSHTTDRRYQCVCDSGFIVKNNTDCHYDRTRQCVDKAAKLPIEDEAQILCTKNCTWHDESILFQENLPLPSAGQNALWKDSKTGETLCKAGEDCTKKVNCDFRDEIISEYNPETIDLNIFPEYFCKPGYYLKNHNRTNPGTKPTSLSQGAPECVRCKCDSRGTKLYQETDIFAEPDENEEDLIFMCDELTGECACLSTTIVNSTTPLGCARCTDTYWQNFPTGLCDHKCGCNEEGSEDLNCDKKGLCNCKAGFFGEDCSKDCNCVKENTINGNAINGCDQMTGQCNDCKEGYYGLKCESKCGCNERGIKDGTTCNYITGQCNCKTKPEYEGLNCDRIRSGTPGSSDYCSMKAHGCEMKEGGCQRDADCNNNKETGMSKTCVDAPEEMLKENSWPDGTKYCKLRYRCSGMSIWYDLSNDKRCCQVFHPLDQKESRRCGIGEGHCDYDADCMEGLVCGSCNCPGDETTGANCADCCTLQSIHDKNLRLPEDAIKDWLGDEADQHPKVTVSNNEIQVTTPSERNDVP